MSGLHSVPKQARLDNMQSSLFALISVERTWRLVVQSDHSSWKIPKPWDSRICICCTSSRNPSFLQKMTFSIFLVRLFQKHWETGLCIYELTRLTRILLVQGLGRVISGRNHNKLYAKFSVDRE